MNRLTTRTVAAPGLPESRIAALYELYSHYYGGTSADVFRRDLADKDYVLLLQDEDNIIRGFSTLKVTDHVFQGQALRALFSGDTIIDHRYWGEQTLPLAWCRLAGQIQAQQPDVPLYWLLIVKGDRTYRYLKVFSRDYYPNRCRPTPPDVQALMDTLAQSRFGSAYHTDSGLVRYAQTQGYLKAEWHTPHTARNPEAQYFHSRNPGAAQGDELVCLTRLTSANLRSFALRGFGQGLADGTVLLAPL